MHASVRVVHASHPPAQVIDLADYRGQLYDYLKARMAAIAPNLTTLVGELVGARLIAHAGSLLSLAKHPASTVQILGAEKALFRALKAKHDTPKYGLIYHASLVGQAPPKFKGKISRILAAKTSLSVRIDALRDETAANVGLTMRAQVGLCPVSAAGEGHAIVNHSCCCKIACSCLCSFLETQRSLHLVRACGLLIACQSAVPGMLPSWAWHCTGSDLHAPV